MSRSVRKPILTGVARVEEPDDLRPPVEDPRHVHVTRNGDNVTMFAAQGRVLVAGERIRCADPGVQSLRARHSRGPRFCKSRFVLAHSA